VFENRQSRVFFLDFHLHFWILYSIVRCVSRESVAGSPRDTLDSIESVRRAQGSWHLGSCALRHLAYRKAKIEVSQQRAGQRAHTSHCDRPPFAHQHGHAAGATDQKTERTVQYPASGRTAGQRGVSPASQGSQQDLALISPASQRDLALLGVGVGLDVLCVAPCPAQGAAHGALGRLGRRGVRRLGGGAPRHGGRGAPPWRGTRRRACTLVGVGVRVRVGVRVGL